MKKKDMLKMYKLEKDKQYVCVAKRGAVDQQSLVIEQELEYPIPIFWVNNLCDVKFFELDELKRQ